MNSIGDERASARNRNGLLLRGLAGAKHHRSDILHQKHRNGSRGRGAGHQDERHDVAPDIEMEIFPKHPADQVARGRVGEDGGFLGRHD